jgi:hypothetical protein
MLISQHIVQIAFNRYSTFRESACQARPFRASNSKFAVNEFTANLELLLPRVRFCRHLRKGRR